MDDRIRQNLGAVCLAVVLAVIGAVVYQSSDALGALFFAGALIVGVVGLLNIALDLMGVLMPKNRRP